MLRALTNLFRKHEAIETAWAFQIANALVNSGQRQAELEHRLDDGTRVDILMAHHAVEIDWACKWAEALGQALYYGLKTERKGVVLLLLEKPTDWHFHERCRLVVRNNTPPLCLWTLDIKTGTLELADGGTLHVEKP